MRKLVLGLFISGLIQINAFAQQKAETDKLALALTPEKSGRFFLFSQKNTTFGVVNKMALVVDLVIDNEKATGIAHPSSPSSADAQYKLNYNYVSPGIYRANQYEKYFFIVRDDSTIIFVEADLKPSVEDDKPVTLTNFNYGTKVKKDVKSTTINTEALMNEAISKLAVPVQLMKKAKAEKRAERQRKIDYFFTKNKSKRTDPELEKKIITHCNGSDFKEKLLPETCVAQRVIFLKPSLDIIRDRYDAILCKAIWTCVIFKDTKTGKIYTVLNAYGYEYEGGGKYGVDLQCWNRLLGDEGIYLNYNDEANKVYISSNDSMILAAMPPK